MGLSGLLIRSGPMVAAGLIFGMLLPEFYLSSLIRKERLPVLYRILDLLTVSGAGLGFDLAWSRQKEFRGAVRNWDVSSGDEIGQIRRRTAGWQNASVPRIYLLCHFTGAGGSLGVGIGNILRVQSGEIAASETSRGALR